ncbi:hypothetical protein BJP40_06375 [Streptomyces sp. CC53]|uniref:hypothetical protein n=1 Tax=Streptomyces sp. CC53 TaxID=1906740 RepID=UPI0008DE5526|nr:hypothetical protein [Streptomyces sp. CC53]OII61148.1 hypothetical protein BJP40_06375 [Streptomyces sp. CC53]
MTVALFHGHPIRVGRYEEIRRWALLVAARGIADLRRFAWTDTGKLTIRKGDREVFTGWEVAEVEEL